MAFFLFLHHCVTYSSIFHSHHPLMDHIMLNIFVIAVDDLLDQYHHHCNSLDYWEVLTNFYLSHRLWKSFIFFWKENTLNFLKLVKVAMYPHHFMLPLFSIINYKRKKLINYYLILTYNFNEIEFAWWLATYVGKQVRFCCQGYSCKQWVHLMRLEWLHQSI